MSRSTLPTKPLAMLEINEMNFDIVRQYLAQSLGRFPHLSCACCSVA